MSRLTRNGTAESVSRDQILRRERGQGKILHVALHLTGTHAPFANTTLPQLIRIVCMYVCIMHIPIKIYRLYELHKFVVKLERIANTVVKIKQGKDRIDNEFKEKSEHS